MFTIKETKSIKFYYSRLYYDFIHGNENLLKYFHFDFHKKDDLFQRADHLSSGYSGNFRQDVSKLLEDYNRGLGCSPETIKNCIKLRSDNCMVVIGGQQPGLFTGPVFIIYKIISIIRLSEFLSGLLKTDVVPVFWNASDDSNFSQINSAFFLDSRLSEVSISKPGESFKKGYKNIERLDAKKRFSDIVLERETILSKVGELLNTISFTDFTPSVKKLLESCADNTQFKIRSKKQGLLTPSSYFSRLITKMFSGTGLIIIDPNAEGLKNKGLELVKNDIDNFTLISDAVNNRGSALEAEGYHSQLSLERDTLDFFIVKNGIRQKIRVRQNAGKKSQVFSIMNFSEGKELLTDRKELESLVSANPDDLSFNVILRPLFQDSILPVVCTVCGPGEAAYFAQTKDVYEFFNMRQPVIYPRFSATIIENKLKKSFSRTGLKYEDLELDKKEIIERIAGSGYGEAVKHELYDIESFFKSGLEKIRQRLADKNPGALNAIDRTEAAVSKELRSLSGKISSEILSKDNIIATDLEKIYSNIFPGGQLQERIVNVFNYINKYDFIFLKKLNDIIDSREFTHKFIEID
ncbi:MAG: hypothetical protein BWY60_00920 [Actinobacteria bacterium ADurb.Bin346]|nr:MAG: hypothetical protein BWY60_00920 [Actinobacteria bacterium ADurb.Bin346]